MRSAAIALVALTGCNQIYGLDQPILLDAQPLPPDAVSLARMRFTAIVPTYDNGTPLDPEFTEIIPSPMIQIGRPGGPLTAARYLPEGYVEIPTDYPGSRWALVYTIPGEEPRELQWTPPENGHYVIPRFVAPGRPPQPGPDAAFDLTPANPPSTYPNPFVYTTGAWTERRLMTVNNMTVTVPYDTVVPFAGGPRFAPDPAQGDRVTLITYATDATCRTATKAAQFDIALTNGTSVDPTPPAWPATVSQLPQTFKLLDTSVGRERVRGALGQAPGTAHFFNYLVGIDAAPKLPQFVHDVPSVPFPTPPMMLLLSCTALQPTADPARGETPAFAELADVPGPQVAHVQVSGGQALASGLVVRAGLSAVAPLATSDNAPPFEASFVNRNIKLGADDITWSSATTTPATLAAGSDPLELTFETETSSSPADYFEITLMRVAGANLEPVRTYITAERMLAIDRAHLTAGTTYTFRLRTFVGVPNARLGDWRQWFMPQSMAQFHSRTFTVP